MSLQDTWDALFSAIDGNPNIGIAAVVDHAANTESVGLDLPPNREIFFGNPTIGAPLMQQAPSAGIDLPLKMLVWADFDGETHITYTNIRHIDLRHGLREHAELLMVIDGALSNFASAAAG